MSRRTFGAVSKLLGAFATALIASGCSSAVSESPEGTTAQVEELGESFVSCVAADATAWAAGVLTIDATANTTGTIIVSPGNSIVKVNGRTCKTAAGATIALSAVKGINVNGKSASSDTIVLDFSAGLPKAPLLVANGIVVDGGETVGSTTTPDTVVVKGSTGVDPVTVGLNAGNTAEGQVDISLTSTTKVANVVLKKLGQTAPGPYQPQLIFSLGTGDDTFSALGGFPTGTPATAVNYGMSIYGGAGNDTIVGGTGADKLNGGGQATDTLDYSARTAAVFTDMESTKVTVWGADLRGVTMAAETMSVDKGGGSYATVTFTTEATPAAIAARINAQLSSAVATVVGNRLLLTSTNGNMRIDSSGTAAIKLGLATGLYENVGNDGSPGVQSALPWKAPATRANTTAYKVGDVVTPATNNTFYYRATVAGTSAGTEPAGLASLTAFGATLTDGTVTWVNAGHVWKAATAFAAGDVIYDAAKSAAYKIATITGKSAASLTTLSTTIGATTTDGGAVWTTKGKSWVASTAYSLDDLATKVAPNGRYYKVTTAGTTAASEPTWPTTTGNTVTDGTVVWTDMGTVASIVVSTLYTAGDFRVSAAGTLATLTGSGFTTGATLTFPATPANFVDNDITWTYTGDKAEADDVQGFAVLSTGSGNDVLIGNALANTLNANGGNDVLMGGPLVTPSSSCPVDKLNGGANDDWFDMGADDGASPTTQNDCIQVVAGSTGLDVVDYSRRTAASTLTVKLDGTTPAGDQTVTPKEADKLGNDVEIVLGGLGDDTIIGTDNDDYLFGGLGNDKIYGGKGDDHIYGGAGDDKLYGDVGNDTFYELTAFPAATAWNEPLKGGSFAGLALQVYGAQKPGAGDDSVFGGTDLTETNKVDFTDAVQPVKVALCSDATATNTDFKNCVPAKSDYVAISYDGTSTSGAGTLNTYVNIEYVAGSLTKANTFIGTANAETFEGGSAVDTILGQGGQDVLFGYADPAAGGSVDNSSADILCGGDDDDTVYGGTASTTEGEGQMDQAHANQATSAVLLSGGSGVQLPSYCTHWASTVNPSTVIEGVNLCFGGATTEQHCAN